MFEGHRLLESRKVFAFIFSVALVPGVLASWGGMMLVQQDRLPVVRDFKVDTAVFNKNGDIELAGSFEKLYPDWMCSYQFMRWYMPDQRLDGRELKLRIGASYADKREVDHENNRFSGLNQFSGWTIRVSDYPDLGAFSGYVQHRCLGVFPARTRLPLMRLPGAADAERVPGAAVQLTLTER